MDTVCGLWSRMGGAAVLTLGFGLHFLGQAFSLADWKRAERLGLQEKEATDAQRDYERGIAAADVLVGWVHLPIGLGLVFGAAWACRLALVPGTLFTYHAPGFWYWTSYQGRGGRPGLRGVFRTVWAAANLACGLWLAGIGLSGLL